MRVWGTGAEGREANFAPAEGSTEGRGGTGVP